MKTTKWHTLKSKSIDGLDLAKQSFIIVHKPNNPLVLIIKKRVLTERFFDGYYNYYGFKRLKTYKGKTLCEQVFSIRLDTLNKAIQQLNN
jgi:hypothetical protein